MRAALLHTTTHVAVGNLTAATTLALAFFAAMLADFQAVAELGWIAGCGVLLCALACFTVLPALLMLFDRRAPGGAHATDVGRRPAQRRLAAVSWPGGRGWVVGAGRGGWRRCWPWSAPAASLTTTTCCTCRPQTWTR